MWKIFGSNSRWDDHSKKMWSPIPVSRKDPVKLPFLEVTPSTVLERLKGQTSKEALEDERNPFRIWAAEPIDLSRSGEIGYRGVYLGKLRQDTAHNGISMSPDKSYGMLSSKHRSPSGRANVTESVPNLTSPNTRRVNLLEPLLQGEMPLTGPPVGSTISKMPPLADRLRRSPTVKRVSSSEFQSANSVLQQPPPESSEETMDDFSDDESSEEDSRRPFSNAKDSGISLLSRSTVRENEKFQIPAINPATRLASTVNTNRSSVRKSGSTRGDYISSEENEDEVVQISLNMKRTSFEDRYDRLYNNQPAKVKAAKMKIPVSTNVFSKNNKGYASKLIPDFISRKHNPPKRIENYDRSYESDFESDERSQYEDDDDGKIERLRKSQLQTRRKLERKVSERNAKRAEEDRLRKYMELESRHSGTSLPLTSPSNDFQISLALPGRGRLPKPRSPRDSVASNLRISKSHEKNLNLAVNKETPRSRSVDRSAIPIRQPTNTRSRVNKRNKIPNQYRLRSRNNLQKENVDLNNTVPRDMKWNYRQDPHCYPTPNTDACDTLQLRSSVSENPLPTVGQAGRMIGTMSKSEINLNDVSRLANNNNLLAQRPVRIAYEIANGSLPPTKYRYVQNGYVKLAKHDNDYVKLPKHNNGYVKPAKHENMAQSRPVGRCECTHQAHVSSRIPVPFCAQCSAYGVRVRSTNPRKGFKPTRKGFEPPWKPEPSSFIHSSRRTPRTGTAIESVRIRTDSTPQKPLKPFPGPQDAYKNTLNLLRSKNWEGQVEGLRNLHRFSAFHEELMIANLKEICVHLITHMRCLRSQVSRTAIQTIMLFFDKFGKHMEPHMERIIPNLLHKTSDTNKFLQQDGNFALDAIVENIPTCKTVPCFINDGLTHRNAAVRTTVSRLLAYSVELLGPTKSLSGQRDITEKILPAAAKLAQDGNQGCRKYAKIIFQHLIDHQNFDAAMKKYVTSDSLRNLQKLLASISS